MKYIKKFTLGCKYICLKLSNHSIKAKTLLVVSIGSSHFVVKYRTAENIGLMGSKD